MMKDLVPYGRHHMGEDDIASVVACLRGPMLTQGKAIYEFESAICNLVGAKYAVAVSNGTAALHIACIAAGLKPGTSAITTPITFIATANAAVYCGAKPLFADVDPLSINISVAAVSQMLSENDDVRVLLPVHFAGLPCDMPELKRAADAAGAVIIEDAAHALGARYSDGGIVGNCAHSLMTTFSFHPVKNITTGEGGIVTTNDETVYKRLLRLRSHGVNKDKDPFLCPSEAWTDSQVNPWYYEMQELGFNYRITDIQCSLGLSQLRKLDSFLAHRRALARRYDEAFGDLCTVKRVQTDGRDRSGHHLYVLRIDYEQLGTTRAKFMHDLRSRGVGSQVHYIPVPSHPYYQRSLTDIPNAVAYYRQALSIPFFYELTFAQQDQVIRAVRELCK